MPDDKNGKPTNQNDKDPQGFDKYPGLVPLGTRGARKVDPEEWVPRLIEGERSDTQQSQISRLLGRTDDSVYDAPIASSHMSDNIKYNVDYQEYLTDPEKKGVLHEDDRDYLQDRRASNQHWATKVYTAVSRFPAQVIGKTIKGIGTTGGFLYETLIGGKEGRNATYDNWIRDIGDFVEQDVAQGIAKVTTLGMGAGEIYGSASYAKEKSFWGKLGYADFWTKDVVDGLAFIASAFIGAKGAGAVGKGVAGGLGASKKASDVASWGTATFYNTVAEAGEEASGIYKDIERSLQGKINPKTGLSFTGEEIEKAASLGAYNTFQANAAILGLSNGVQAKMFLFPGSLARKGKKLKDAVRSGKVKVSDVKGSKNILAASSTGIVTEGLWEENIQTAISSVEKDYADGTLDHVERNGYMPAYFDNLSSFGKGIAGNPLESEQMEAAMGMTIGSLIGTGMGVREGAATTKEERSNIEGFEKYIDQLDKDLRIVNQNMFEDVTSPYKKFKGKDEEGNEVDTYVNPETGKVEVDLEASRKLFYQTLYDKRMYDSGMAAQMNGDVYQDTYNREFALGTMAYNYSQKATDRDDASWHINERMEAGMSEEEKKTLGGELQETKQTATAYLDTWDRVVAENRDSEELEGSGFNHQFRKVVYYHEIKKNALNKMRERAEAEGNDKLVESVDDLLEKEDEYINKLKSDKSKFKSVWERANLSSQKLAENVGKVNALITKATEPKEIKKLNQAKEELKYLYELQTQVLDDPFQHTTPQRIRKDERMSKLNEFHYNLGKSEITRQNLNEDIQEIEAAEVALTELENSEESTQDQIKEAMEKYAYLLKEKMDNVTGERKYLGKESAEASSHIISKAYEYESTLTEQVDEINSQAQRHTADIEQLEDRQRAMVGKAKDQYDSSAPTLFSGVKSIIEDIDPEGTYEGAHPNNSTPGEVLSDAMSSVDMVVSSGSEEAIEDLGFVLQDVVEAMGETPSQDLEKNFKTIFDAYTSSEQADPELAKEIATKKEELSAMNAELKDKTDNLTKMRNITSSSKERAQHSQDQGVDRDYLKEQDAIGKDSKKLRLKLEREFADSTLDQVSAQEKVADKDPEGYDNSASLTRMLGRLETMQRLYKGSDIAETPQFKGFLDNLSASIKKAKELLDLSKENALNRKARIKKIAEREATKKFQFIGMGFDELGSTTTVKSVVRQKVDEILGVDRVNEILGTVEETLDAEVVAEVVRELIKKGSASQIKELEAIYKTSIKSNKDSMNSAIQTLSKDEKSRGADSFVDGTVYSFFRPSEYFRNPVKAFKGSILSFFNSALLKAGTYQGNEGNNPIFIFSETNNVDELYDNINRDTEMSEELKAEFSKIVLLHKNYLDSHSALDWLNSKSEFSSEHTQEDLLLKEEASSGKEFKEVPTVEQLSILRQIVKAVKAPISGKKTGDPLSRAWTYLKGPAGSGKSRIVLKWVSKILGIKSNEIYAFSHKDSSSKNIADSVGAATPGTATEFLEDFSTAVSGKRLVVIDEIAFFDNPTMKQMGNLVTEENARRIHAKEELLRVIILGDPGQIRKESIPTLERVHFLPEMNEVTPLVSTVRSNVPSIVDIQNQYRRNPSAVKDIAATSNIEFGEPYDTENSTVGVHAGQTNAQLLLAIKANKDSGRSKVIVVNTEESKKKYSSDPLVTELFNKGELHILTYDEVQGETFLEVYTDVQREGKDLNGKMFAEKPTELEYNTAMYTATSRAKEYLFIVHPSAQNFVNVKLKEDSSKLSDQLKGNFSDLAKRLSKEKEVLSQFLKDYVPVADVAPTKPEEREEEVDTSPEESEGVEVVENDIPEDTDTQEDIPDEFVHQGEEVPEMPEDELLKGEHHLHRIKYPQSSATKGNNENPYPFVLPEGVTIKDEQGNDIITPSSEVIYVRAHESGIRTGKNVPTLILGRRQENGIPQDSWVKLGVMTEEDRSLDFHKYFRVDEQKAWDSDVALSYDPHTGQLSSSGFNPAGTPVSNWKIGGGSPLVFKGNLYSTNKLTFNWGDQLEGGAIQKVLKRFVKGFFNNQKHETLNYSLKIYSKGEIQNPSKLAPELHGNTFVPRPGVPYLVILNPRFKGKKGQVPNMLVRLTPRPLTTEDLKGTGYLSSLRRLYEAARDLEDKAPNFRLGSKYLANILKHIAHSEDSFREGSSGKIVYEAKNYTYEQLLQDSDREFGNSNINELSGLRESGITREDFEAIWDFAKQAVPEVFGYVTRNKYLTLTEEEAELKKKELLPEGKALIKYNTLSKDASLNTYVIKLGDLVKPDGNKSIDLEKERKLRSGKGEAQQVWNSIARSHKEFPHRIEESDRGTNQKTAVTAKGLLADANYAGYRNYLVSLIRNQLELSGMSEEDAIAKSSTRLRGMSEKAIANYIVKSIPEENRDAIRHELESKRQQFRMNPINLEDLERTVGDSAFSDNEESQVSWGGKLQYMALPLNKAMFNDLGKDPKANEAELDGLVKTSFQGVTGASIVVASSTHEESGTGLPDEREFQSKPVDKDKQEDLNKIDQELDALNETQEQAELIARADEAYKTLESLQVSPETFNELRDLKESDPKSFVKEVKELEKNFLEQGDTSYDEEYDPTKFGDDSVDLDVEQTLKHEGVEYFKKAGQWYTYDDILEEDIEVDQEEMDAIFNNRRTFQGDVQGERITQSEAKGLAKRLFPDLNITNRSWLNAITFGLLGKPKGKEIELKFLSKASLDELALPGEDLKGLYLNGVAYVLKNEDGTVSEQVLRHELFHKIFNEYLTKADRKKLRLSAKRVFPDTDIKGMSAIEFEEFMADNYMAYQDKSKTFKGRIKQFFQNLKRMFNFIQDNRTEVEKLFDRINLGSIGKRNAFPIKVRRTLNSIKKDFKDAATFKWALDKVQRKFHWALNNDDIVTSYEEVYQTTYNSLHGKYTKLRSQVAAYENKLNSLSGAKLDRALKTLEKLKKDLGLYESFKTEKTYKAVIDYIFPDSLFNKKSKKLKVSIKDQVEKALVELDEKFLAELENVNLKDVIENSENIDNEQKLSTSVKIMLSNVPDSAKKNAWLSSRYAFVKMLRLMESVSFEEDFLGQLFEAAREAAGLGADVTSFQGHESQVKQLYLVVARAYEQATNPKYKKLDNTDAYVSDRMFFTSLGGDRLFVSINNNVTSEAEIKKIRRMTPPELEIAKKDGKIFTQSLHKNGKDMTVESFMGHLTSVVASKDGVPNVKSSAEYMWSQIKKNKKFERFSIEKGVLLLSRPNGEKISPNEFSIKMDSPHAFQKFERYLQIDGIRQSIKQAWKAELAQNTLREFASLFTSMREKTMMIADVEYKNGSKSYSYTSENSIGQHTSLLETLKGAIKTHFESEAINRDGDLKTAYSVFIGSTNWNTRVLPNLRSNSVQDKVLGIKEFLNYFGLDFMADKIVLTNTEATRFAEDIKEFFGTHLSKLGEEYVPYDRLSKKAKSKLDSEQEAILKEPVLSDVDFFFNTEGSFIKRLSRNMSKSSQWLRATSVRDASGNTVYLHHNSSQGDDVPMTISKLRDSHLEVKGGAGTRSKLRIPKHLKTRFFKNNLFVSGLNKIFKLVDHDGQRNVKTGRNVPYTAESRKEWLSRNLNAGFFATVAQSAKSSPKYIQWFHTISNKPRIKGAEVSFLGPKEIKQGIDKFLTQFLERPKIKKHIKGYDATSTTNFDVFRRAIEDIYGVPYEEAVQKYDNKTDRRRVVSKVYDILTEDSKAFAQTLINEKFEFAAETNRAHSKLFEEGLIDAQFADQGTHPLEGKGSVINYPYGRPEDYNHSLEQVHAVVDAVYKNNYINSYFLNQLVTGDPAYFKHSLDIIKRMSGVFAQGLKGLVNDVFGMNKTYKTVVVGDAIENFESIQNFLSSLIHDNPSFKDLTEAQQKDIQPLLDKFGNDYELTDAQGFILPERKWDIERGFGRSYGVGRIFKGAHFENVVRWLPTSEAFTPAEIENREDLKIEGDQVLQETVVPFMVKYSTVVLSDELVAQHPALGRLRNKMRNHKDGMISEMVFGSGNKVGEPKNKISAAQAVDELTPFPYLSVVELSNENFRMQSNPDHISGHSEKGVANPTQLGYFLSVLKELMSKGENFAEKIYGHIAELFEIGTAEFKEEISNSDGVVTEQSFGDFITSQMTGAGNERSLELLEEGVSYNAPHIVNKAFSQVMSRATKLSVGLRFPGEKLTLQSSYGIRKKDGTELQFIKRDGKILSAETMLPRGILSKEEEAAVERGEDIHVLPNLLGFRIPSTELHSAVPLKVVGFYDSRGTSAVVVPKELVPLHGSDFDVDSLFVIKRGTYKKENPFGEQGAPIGYYKDGDLWKIDLPRFRKDVEAADATDSQKRDAIKAALKNVVLEGFLTITTHPDNLRRMLSPITMEMFNGNSTKEEQSKTGSKWKEDSIFKMIQDLQVKSAEKFGESVEEAKELQSKADLSTFEGNYSVFKSNMDGSALTGVFANGMKSLAYMVEAGYPVKDKKAYVTKKAENELKVSKENLKLLKSEETKAKKAGRGTKTLSRKIEEEASNIERLNEELSNSEATKGRSLPFLTDSKNYLKLGGKVYDRMVERLLDGTPIWEVLDSLVNAAIDNVKEQILPIINANGLTANALSAMLALGVPAKTAVLMVKQPVVQQMDVSGRKEMEITRANKKLTKAYKELFDVPEDFDISEEALNYPISEESLKESLVNNKVDFALIDTDPTSAFQKLEEKGVDIKVFILRQLAVLEEYEKAVKVGEDIAELSSALNIVRAYPGDISSMDKQENRWKKVFKENKDGEKEFNENFSFDIPFFLDVNPHISSAYKLMEELGDLIKSKFKKHHEAIAKLTTAIKTEIGLQKSNVNEDDLKYSLREDFMRFVSTSIPLMNKVTHDTKSEIRSTVNGRIQPKAITGSEAWSQNFIKDLEALQVKLRNEGRPNLFLDSITTRETRHKHKYVVFTAGSKLEYADILELQEAFEDLRIFKKNKYGKFVENQATSEFSELQNDFVRYALINFGMQFASTNYSQVLPADLIKPFVDQMLNEVDKYLGDTEILQLKEQFELEVALNYADKIQPVRNAVPYKKTVNGKQVSAAYEPLLGIYYNLAYTKSSPDQKLPKYISQFNNVYRRIDSVAENASLSGVVYYKLLGRPRERVTYMMHPDATKDYSIDASFNPNVPSFGTTDIKVSEIQINSNYLLEVGDVVQVYEYGDTLRSNPRYVEITEHTETSEDDFPRDTFQVKDASKSKLDEAAITPEGDALMVKVGNENEFSYLNDNKAFKNNSVGSKMPVKETLNSMLTQGSHSGSTLAKWLTDNFSKDLESLDIEYTKALQPDSQGKVQQGFWTSAKPNVVHVSIGTHDGKTMSKYSSSEMEKTFLHELMHALTMRAMLSDTKNLSTEQRKALRRMNNLFRNFKKKLTQDGKNPSKIYGMTNTAEFIAEAFSNPEFQELLDSYQLAKDKPTTFLSRFIQFVKQFFGVYDEKSVLSQVMNATIPLIDTSISIPKGYATNVITLSKEDTPSLDSRTQSILDGANEWELPIDEETGDQANHYVHTPSNNQVDRVSDSLVGFLSKFVKGIIDDGRPTYEHVADNLWKDLDPETSRIIEDGTAMNRAEYVEWAKGLQEQGKLKGKIIHKYIEYILHNQHSTQTQEQLSKELMDLVQNKMNLSKGQSISQIDKQYNWVPKVLPKIFDKLGLNLFKKEYDNQGKEIFKQLPNTDENKDLTFAEVTVGSNLLKHAGTVDMLVKHKDDTYSVLDWKTGRKFEKEVEHKLLKYGNQFDHIYDNPRNKAHLQLMFYSVMLKVENPDMKFRDLVAVWMPNEYEALAYDPNKKVDIRNYLKMIEDYFRTEEPETYKQILIKSPNTFKVKDYNASSATLSQTMLNQNKAPFQVYEMKQQELKEIIQSKLDHRTLSLEDRQRIEKLTKELVAFAHDEGFEVADWTEDISFGSRWMGSNSDIDHPIVQIYKKTLDEAKDKAEKEYIKKWQQFETLLRPVYDDYLTKNGKKGVRTATLRLADATKYGDLYKFAYKEISVDGAKIDRIKISTDEEWKSLTPEQQKLLTFVNDTFAEPFKGKDAFLNRTAASLKNMEGRMDTYSDIQLYNKNKASEDQFEYYRGYIPVVAPTEQDIIEKHGTFSKEYLKHLKNKYLTFFYEYQYEQWGVKEEAIPIRYLGTRWLRANKNHTSNLAIMFDRHMRGMYQKKYADDVHALGRGMQIAVQMNREGTDKSNIESYLDDHLMMELVNKTQEPVDLSKKAFLSPMDSDKARKINVWKLMKGARAVTSGAIMWLKPVAATKNAAVAYLHTMKEASLSSITQKGGKMLGMDTTETEFTHRDLVKAQKEVMSMMKDSVTGKLQENKTWLLMKKLRYDVNMYEFASTAKELLTEKRLFGNDTMYFFHSVGEEAVAASILVAQMRHMKHKTGESLWSSYAVEDVTLEDGTVVKDVVYNGPTRGYKRVQGELVPIRELDSREAHRLRHVYQRIQGGYRRGERTALEFYFIGQAILQFKKYMPNLLKRNFGSKKDSEALGQYKIVEENGKVVTVKDDKGNDVPVMEWQRRVTEGRWRTMAGVIAEAFTIRKSMKGLDGSYKWSNLSTEQKRNVIEGSMMFLGMFAMWAMYGAAYDDESDKNSWKKSAAYIIDNVSQDWNIVDLTKNISRFPEMPAAARTYKSIDAASETAWNWWVASGTSPGYDPKQAWTEDGDIKGWTELKRGVPLISSWYSWFNFMENVDTRSNYRKY